MFPDTYSDCSLHPADGFALGAAVATGQVTVQVVIFLAVALHKVSCNSRG